jgi:hypothetical protein
MRPAGGAGRLARATAYPAGGLARAVEKDKSSDGKQIYLRDCCHRGVSSVVRRNDAGRADGVQRRAESVHCQLHQKYGRFCDRILHREL